MSGKKNWRDVLPPLHPHPKVPALMYVKIFASTPSPAEKYMSCTECGAKAGSPCAIEELHMVHAIRFGNLMTFGTLEQRIECHVWATRGLTRREDRQDSSWYLTGDELKQHAAEIEEAAKNTPTVVVEKTGIIEAVSSPTGSKWQFRSDGGAIYPINSMDDFRYDLDTVAGYMYCLRLCGRVDLDKDFFFDYITDDHRLFVAEVLADQERLLAEQVVEGT